MVDVHNEQRGSRPVSESTVVDVCGDDTVPEMAVIEQQWRSDPIPKAELAGRAEEARERQDLEVLSESRSVAVGGDGQSETGVFDA